MKAAEITFGTEYRMRDGWTFAPQRRSEWKQGAFDGLRTDRRNMTRADECQLELEGHLRMGAIHISQFVMTEEAFQAQERARLAAAEAETIARRHRLALEEAELADQWGDVVAALAEVGVTAELRFAYDYKTGATLPELRTDWMDHADLAAWLHELAVAGCIPSEPPRSTALVVPLLEVAAGRTPEPTGHSSSLVLRGADELAGLRRLFT
jgi:hypothetical protein